ncbi:hypothetical protein ACFLU5_04205 [Bacteroidota bacterium]
MSSYRSNSNISNQVGYYSAISVVVMTVIAFGLAITAIPIAGPNCPGDCIEYPYTDIASRFPKDYLWMYPAMIINIIFVILIASIHHYIPRERKIFSQLGFVFAVMTAGLLITDYFIQITVIQTSIVNGETDGIALLTQYNPHGIFIALEELGYLMMSISYLFIALAFSGSNRLERTIRWILSLSFVMTISSLVYVSAKHGIDRSCIFEVAAITIDWLTLIVVGILLSILFKRETNVSIE